MRVLIVGDVHGQHERLATHLEAGRRSLGIEAAIQVGDFGFEERAMKACRAPYPVPLYVIDGNHEDHQWLQRALESGADDMWRSRLQLFYQRRPSVARIGGATVGFIGGALHVDRPQRHNRAAGLPNYILRRHADEASALFNEARPDLIVSHSCPSRIGIGLAGAEELQWGVIDHIVSAGFDPGPSEDCGEAELSRVWRTLTRRPKAWVFGHHHRQHAVAIDGTLFVCVGDVESSESQPVIWETETLALTTGPPASRSE
jgi:predicted phosphodiesterase